MKAPVFRGAWLMFAVEALALLVALAVLLFTVLRRLARRVRWLAVASDLLMLAGAGLLLFTFWFATCTLFCTGA